MKKIKNNAGFSLVELIIVIAIMAVLVGALAPQYMRYVEKSKIAADEELLDEIKDVLIVIATEPTLNVVEGKDASVRFTKDGKADFLSDKELREQPAFYEIVDTTKTYQFKSNYYLEKAKSGKFEVKLKHQDGIYQVVIIE